MKTTIAIAWALFMVAFLEAGSPHYSLRDSAICFGLIFPIGVFMVNLRSILRGNG